MSVQTRVIQNERVFPFPYGQGIPATVLQAAYELGKNSASFAVDANPFVTTWPRASQFSSRYEFLESERIRRAEAVAWLRGHYVARKSAVWHEAA